MRSTSRDAVTALAELCTLEASERNRRWRSVSRLLATAVSAFELADGVSFEFLRTGAGTRGVLDFLRVECGCCPTLSYTVRPGSTGATIVLDIRGRDADVTALKALYAEFLRA
jgi:hypothetical protein